jgi:hypothetical protein
MALAADVPGRRYLCRHEEDRDGHHHRDNAEVLLTPGMITPPKEPTHVERIDDSV